MHKIYEVNEEYKYNLEYRIIGIFLSNLVNKLITSFLFEKLVNFQDEFIRLKNNLKNEDSNNNEIEKSFRKRTIIFYIISISINFIIWYYISCFCSVYSITQEYLLIDFISNTQINFVNCFIISFIYLFLKLIIKQCELTCIKYMNEIINHDFCKFIIEQIIGFIIMLIIKYIGIKSLFSGYFYLIYLIIIIIILIK